MGQLKGVYVKKTEFKTHGRVAPCPTQVLKPLIACLVQSSCKHILNLPPICPAYSSFTCFTRNLQHVSKSMLSCEQANGRNLLREIDRRVCSLGKFRQPYMLHWYHTMNIILRLQTWPFSMTVSRRPSSVQTAPGRLSWLMQQWIFFLQPDSKIFYERELLFNMYWI